ncbi:hypothetical protein BDZ94DRAFT_1333105 [Collybia nuda]|uniref:Uncharacterized protein n=1 Tax=Collybia nuda TaxID=64659 RepID=A0A9P5XZD3_9AGAR|nr:hypothetical protein BDZ94DRAFT_1333105 [Collybia nuda]
MPVDLDRSDALSAVLITARSLKSVSDLVPFPYIKSVFEAVITVLELVEQVDKNNEDLLVLSRSIVAVAKIIDDEIRECPATTAIRFKTTCDQFSGYLKNISSDLNTLIRKHSVWRFKRYLKAAATRDKIQSYTRQLEDLRSNLILSAATGTHLDVARVDDRILSVHQDVSHIKASIVQLESVARSPVQTEVTFEEDFYRLRRGDIKLDFATAARLVTIGSLSAADNQVDKVTTITNIKGHITSANAVKTFQIYKGKDAEEIWQKQLLFFGNFPSSPYISQLYGFYLVSIDRYAKVLSTSEQFVAYEHNLLSDFRSACEHVSKVLNKSNLEWDLAYHTLVDSSSGKISLSHFPVHGKPEAFSYGVSYVNFILVFLYIASPWGHVNGDSGIHILGHFPHIRPEFYQYWDTLTGNQGQKKDRGWTRFTAPLGQRYDSHYVLYPSYSLNLCTNISCQKTGNGEWLAQAHHWLNQMDPESKSWHLSDISVAQRIDSRLRWELCPLADIFTLEDTFMAPDTIAPQEFCLPKEVYVFVSDIKVDKSGKIIYPNVYWSTQPDIRTTEGLPSGSFVNLELSESIYGVPS